MLLKRTLKKVKDAAIGGLALTALSLSANNAVAQDYETRQPARIIEQAESESQPVPEQWPERNIILDFASPETNAEANSHLDYSLNQAIGKASDHAGIAWGFDKSLEGRLALSGAHIFPSFLTKYWSHEFGHVRAALDAGATKYWFEYSSNLLVPRMVNFEFSSPITLDENLLVSAGGLNQDELNAYTFWRQSNRRKIVTFDDGINFLLRKGWDIRYNLGSGNDSFDDVNNIVNLLKEKGFRFSKKDHLVQALVADLLSAQTYDSILAVGNYLFNGERSIKPLTFDVGGVEVTPPLINYYITTKGPLFIATSRLDSPKVLPVELSVGSTADKRYWRLGAQVDVEAIPGVLYFSPFAALNNSGKGTSVSGGAELELRVADRVSLNGKVEYVPDSDIYKSDVLGKREGVNALAGAKITW